MNKLLSKLIMIFVPLIYAGSVCAQNKLFVFSNASGNNSGLDWNNAFTSIQHALNEAMVNNNIDTICIAEGTYYPEQLLPGYANNRMRTLHLSRGNLTILGSYNMITNQRNLDSFPTILSGEIGDTSRLTDNAHYLFVIMGDTINTLNNLFIDGIVFEKVYANNTTSINYNNSVGVNRLAGGALFTQHATVNMSNSIFRNNESLYTASSIFCAMGTINIDNVIFESNKSAQGGNVRIDRHGNINITRSIFSNNQSNQLAATILLESQNSVINTIKECEFVNNTGQTLFCTHESHTIMDYSQLSYNVARLDLLCNYRHNAAYTRNKIHNNTHQLDLFKLGLEQFLVAQNLIANNHGLDSARSALFSNNTLSSDKKIYNNSIVNNSTAQYLNTNQLNTILFKNNILAHNYFADTTSLYLHTHYNSYVQGKSDTTNGNINAIITTPYFKHYDTQYVNANFELEYCSPLINKGDTSNLYFTNLVLDLNNHARIVDQRIDLGAFEKQSDPNLLNNIGLSTIQDNHIPLKPICTANEWTYYRSTYHTDTVVMGIKWGSLNEDAKEEALVYLTKDTTPYAIYKSSGDSALSILPRNWHIDLGRTTLSIPISVQFFYSEREKEQISELFNNNGFQIDELTYITVPNSIDASTQLFDFNYNNHNYITHNITPNVINNLHAVTYTNLLTNLNGTLIIKAKKTNTSLHQSTIKKLTLSPNPTSNILYLDDHSLDGVEYYIYNVLGENIAKGWIKHSQINVRDLPLGIYVLMINNETIRFIKE